MKDLNQSIKVEAEGATVVCTVTFENAQEAIAFNERLSTLVRQAASPHTSHILHASRWPALASWSRQRERTE